MAFTRKTVSTIEGLTADQIDKIMNLHGTSMSDYQLRSEFDTAVKTEVDKQIGEQKMQFEGVDLKALQEKAGQADKLSADIASLKLGHAIESRLLKEQTVNSRAVSALLDMSKITVDDKGAITGLDEQITALKESEPWAFGATTPAATGLRQTTPAAQLTGVEAEFMKRNPGLNL